MVTGVFCATDSVLFYIFFEAMLIPMYVFIGVLGGEKRQFAAVKFFIFTFAGSLLLLLALIYLGISAQSFNILDLINFKLTALEQKLLFICFFAGFAVKLPMWPVHTWLPDAHAKHQL